MATKKDSLIPNSVFKEYIKNMPEKAVYPYEWVDNISKLFNIGLLAIIVIFLTEARVNRRLGLHTCPECVRGHKLQELQGLPYDKFTT